MWESKLMLKSRVQSAKGFKKEFHDLLETTYQNTFTKNMIHELRSIVNRGDSFHLSTSATWPSLSFQSTVSMSSPSFQGSPVAPEYQT